MKPYRSFLFVPGNRRRMLEKGPTTDADALLFDLEDAVPAGEKDVARSMLAELIPGLSEKPAFVRTNAPSTGETRADLEAVVGPGLEGVFVPKVDSAEEVLQVSRWLEELEAATGTPPGQIEMVCMIETAVGLYRAHDIAAASERVASLCCSSAENGDLQTDLGTDWSPEGLEMMYPRAKIVVDSRAAGIEHPVDGVYAALADLDGLEHDTTLSKRLGYRGRAIIHPSHIEAVNRIYSPDPETVAYCRGLLEAFDEALAAGQASVAYDGKMIDYAMATWARRILSQAALLGIEEGAR